MNGNSPVTSAEAQYPHSLPENPIIALTEIVTFGAILCVLILVSAKYNRGVELKYEDFTLNINPPVPTIPA